MKLNRILTAGILMLGINTLSGQQTIVGSIDFPDIPGYKTLVCDFHLHTVFSDGEVWPSIRVREALNDGLDAISITDHIEYQPNKNDIPDINRNRPFEIASEAAANSGMIIISGAEITREMPPGHANAIFIPDANKLKGIDSLEVFREAKRQGAFVIWNHPHWHAQSPNGTAILTKMHKQLIKEGLIKGIEIVNEHSYSDEALKIAIDNKLTLIGASDIHDLIDWQFETMKGGHRPVTLVFAIEKSAESIKEALQLGRTAVWFDQTLLGKQEFLVPLIQQSLAINKTWIPESYNGKSTVVTVWIENKSDCDYILENVSQYTFYDNINVITLKANSITSIDVKPLKPLKTFTLTFKVLNAVTAPKTHPTISINVYTVQN